MSGRVYMPSSLNEMSNRQRVKRPITLSSHWLLNQPLYFHLPSNKNKYGKYIVNIQTVERKYINIVICKNLYVIMMIYILIIILIGITETLEKYETKERIYNMNHLQTIVCVVFAYSQLQNCWWKFIHQRDILRSR